MSHHGGGGAGAMSEVMMVGEGDQRGKEKERELCTGDALGPEKQEMGGGWEMGGRAAGARGVQNGGGGRESLPAPREV